MYDSDLEAQIAIAVAPKLVHFFKYSHGFPDAPSNFNCGVIGFVEYATQVFGFCHRFQLGLVREVNIGLSPEYHCLAFSSIQFHSTPFSDFFNLSNDSVHNAGV